jgi:excisionase family DNA binding protein
MIELTVTLTDRQLAEIAARAAALVVTSAEPGSPWLNVPEAAEHLRCSKDRIYDLIQLGKLKPRRDGRRVLLRRDDLDAYLEGRAPLSGQGDRIDGVLAHSDAPGSLARIDKRVVCGDR